MGSSGVGSSGGRRQGAADGNELTRKAGDRSGERHGTEDDRARGWALGEGSDGYRENSMGATE